MTRSPSRRPVRAALRAVSLLALAVAAALTLAAPAQATSFPVKIHGNVTGGTFACTVYDATGTRVVLDCSWTDTASDGRAVYMQYHTIRGHAPDGAWLRLTAHAGGHRHTGHKYLQVDAQFNPVSPWYGDVDKWAFRVCTTTSTSTPWIPPASDKCGYQHVVSKA
jgi:hypothetical protein